MDKRAPQECINFYSTTDAAGFITYKCSKKKGLILGGSNYLEGSHISKHLCEDCDMWEERRRKK